MPSSQAAHHFKRRLHLNAGQQRALLDALKRNAESAGRAAMAKRRDERHDYAVADIPVWVQHPDGGQSCFLMYGRNVSRRGIGLLHGGFIHRDSACRVVLRPAAGAPLIVPGVVRHCRLLGGNCHEIGIRFTIDIDLKGLFPVGEADGKDAAAPPPSPAEGLEGTAVVADAGDPDMLLLEHQLRRAGLTTRAATTTGQTLDAVRREHADLLIIGPSVEADGCGLYIVREVRNLGLTLPILLVSAQADDAAIRLARRAGLSFVLAKPYSVDVLMARVRALLGAESDGGAPLDRTVDDDPCAADGQHAASVQRIAERLQAAHDASDVLEVRALCWLLQRSAINCGLGQVASAAAAALDQLDAGRPDETGAALSRLSAACRSIASHAAGACAGSPACGEPTATSPPLPTDS